MTVSTWTRRLLALLPTLALLACSAQPSSEQETSSVALAVEDTGVVIEPAPPPGKGGRCGNGKCQKGETCGNCPQDCGPCPFCGDNTCDPGETCSACFADCGPCPCGDNICQPEFGESCQSCPGDCGSCCGNGICNPEVGENSCTCPADCTGPCP